MIIFVINSCSSPNTLVEMPEVIAPSWEESKGIRAGNWDIEDSYEEIAVEVKPENKIVVVTPEPVKTKTASDYILQDSSSRLLTRADVEKLGLSLREINYAKNEIYARHGRKFHSMELQNYFNSKSWYRGTAAPQEKRRQIIYTQYYGHSAHQGKVSETAKKGAASGAVLNF